MQPHRSNRLLPVLGLTAVAALVLLLGRGCEPDATPPVQIAELPDVALGDADTPADTITTLTANVAAMTRELEALQAENAALRRDNQTLLRRRETLEDDVSHRIATEINRLREEAARSDTSAFENLHRRIDALSESVGSQTEDLPVGFGYEAQTAEIVWIEPLDAAVTPTANATLDPNAFDTVQPVFTVPRNATLLGSTAMTAMLGRVPIRGEVRDPMPFKVLTGSENLAANGYGVPGVAGMVWTGTAIGDWSLSCVSGELHSVTFIFADGSIQTLSSDESDDQGGSTRRALGWVSDARGVPCVTGSRKSNAGRYLSQRIAAKAVEAAADAAASAQTSTVIRDSGAVTSTVDGELGSFVLGRSVAEGGDEIARWLAERQAQSFDAVFVPAGADLVIHVDRELALDLDPHARKLHHAAKTASTAVDRLD